MLYSYTLDEIRNNINTGVEYEIALFYKLLSIKPLEQAKAYRNTNPKQTPPREVSEAVGSTLAGNRTPTGRTGIFNSIH